MVLKIGRSSQFYHFNVLVVTLDGSVPIKYGLLLNTDDNYKKLKKQLAKLCCLTPAQLLMAELIGASIKVNMRRL